MHTLNLYTFILRTSTIFTTFLVSQTSAVGFYASSVLSYDLKCNKPEATKNKNGVSRDEIVEGLFLNYTEYDKCPNEMAESCNNNGIKGYIAFTVEDPEVRMENASQKKDITVQIHLRNVF